jgi:hypothetical protein
MSWEDTIKKSSDKHMMERIIRYLKEELESEPIMPLYMRTKGEQFMSTKILKELLEGAKQIREKME